MQAKAAVKLIMLLLGLASVGFDVARTTAAEPDKEATITVVKVKRAPTAAPLDDASVDDLILQAIVPCTATLAPEKPAVKSLPASNNAPQILKTSTATKMSPVPTPPPDFDEPTGDMPWQKTKPTTTDAATPAPQPTCCEPQNQCGNCFDCCKCGAPGDFWVRDEYLGWWAQGGRLPTLVATSATGTLPATVPLYGNATYNDRYRSGNWTQIGMWLDCCHTHGIQADYFFVGRQSSPFFASSNGDPILTRPFIDATTGLPAEELIAVPGIVVGSVSIDNHNSLDGAGVSLRRNLCCCCDCCDHCCSKDCGCKSDCDSCWCGQDCSRLDLVYGFRYYGFRDNVGIRENLTSIDPLSPIAIGTQFDVRDSFVSQSNFYGFEFGLIQQRYCGRWMYEGTGKVAIGDMSSIVWINGSTAVSFPGQPTAVNQGGLLALSSNIGRHDHNSFVAIPQISGRIGYRATEQLTFLAGYTLMYFSQIARAGDQIDTTINPNLIPPPVFVGPNRPAFNFRPSDLLLQGFTLGLEYSF